MATGPQQRQIFVGENRLGRWSINRDSRVRARWFTESGGLSGGEEGEEEKDGRGDSENGERLLALRWSSESTLRRREHLNALPREPAAAGRCMYGAWEPRGAGESSRSFLGGASNFTRGLISLPADWTKDGAENGRIDVMIDGLEGRAGAQSNIEATSGSREDMGGGGVLAAPNQEQRKYQKQAESAVPGVGVGTALLTLSVRSFVRSFNAACRAGEASLAGARDLLIIGCRLREADACARRGMNEVAAEATPRRARKCSLGRNGEVIIWVAELESAAAAAYFLSAIRDNIGSGLGA
ncbi:hypothetical protein FB451DRAFT_1501484 [Mycena latifolia]|nr:hypothetical protein FB451DRAFT_1501484 [Mycena latifolia]